MTPPADARLDLGPIKARYQLLADAGIARPIPAGLPHATLISDLANLIAEVERLAAASSDESSDHPGISDCAARALGYECTRGRGHVGDHVAHGGNGQQYYRWPSHPIAEPPQP